MKTLPWKMLGNGAMEPEPWSGSGVGVGVAVGDGAAVTEGVILGRGVG